MRANELMIGDWVQNTNGNEGQVIGFQFYPGSERIEVVMRYNPNSTCWSNEEHLVPIPLTAEILEKNGFYDHNTQWYYKRYWSNVCFDIAVALDYREIEVSEVCGSGTDCEEVEYGSTIAFGSDINVHELQHALRLCGLNDLADNFKA